jgi:hypothetical protein
MTPALLWIFSLFGVLTTKGEKTVIFIIFFILVCNGQVVREVAVIWTITYVCVACKTLMSCISLYNIVPIMLSLYVWMSFMITYFI